MVGAMTLSRALAAGGAVIWEPPDKPRLRVAPTFAESLRREADGVREVLRRAAVFKAQLDAEAGGPVVPYFLLPGAPPPGLGACISCGAASRGWRCLPCLVAVYVALEAIPALTAVLAGQETTA